MRKSSLLVALVLVFGCLAWGQAYKGQGKASGIVTDTEGRPLDGVRVVLFSVRSQSGFETKTNAKGEWRANYIRGGPWNIDFEKDGYLPKKISTEFKEYDRNPPVEIKMVKIEGLVVSDALKEAVKKGNDLFNEGKYEEAAAAFAEIVAGDENAYALNKNIGNCWFALQKYDVAEEYYRKVLDKEPENGEIMMLIGNTYSNRGDQATAMEWYKKIDIQKISDATALFNIANGLFSKSEFEEALKYSRRGLEVQPDSSDLLYLTGLINLSLNRTEDSIAAFERYLKTDAESARADQVRSFLDFLKKK